MTSQLPNRDRIFGLDLMRAVAILAVLGSHILYIFPDQSGSIVNILRLGGIMGVELFFVLSGFLIGRILFRIYVNSEFKRSDLSHFLVRRWFRTLPNYYAVLVLNIVLVTAIGRDLPNNWPSYFFFLQNFASEMDVFFTESWSLPVEEFAYLVGPFVLMILGVAFAKAKRKTLFLVATLVIIATFISTKINYTVHLTDYSIIAWNQGLKAVVLYRIDAIFYGVLAAYISIVHETTWRRYAVPLFILGILFFIGFQQLLGTYNLIPEENPWLWSVVYLPFHSICFCLLLPMLSNWKVAPKIIGRPITQLSIISYAIYLLHYGLIIQSMRWIWPIEDVSFYDRLGWAGIYFVILFLISYWWYRLYEKPMTDLRDRKAIKRFFT